VPVPVVFAGGDFTQAGTGNVQGAPGIAAFWGPGAHDDSGSPIDGQQVTDTSGMVPWGGGLPSGAAVEALRIAPDGSSPFAVYVGGHTPSGALLEAHQFKISTTDPNGHGRTTENGGAPFGNWMPGPQSCDGAGCTSSVNALALSSDSKTLYFAGD